jgi:hypothetical protein
MRKDPWARYLLVAAVGYAIILVIFLVAQLLTRP